MTCCVVALALAMQLIESWRRVKALVGIRSDDNAVPRATGAAIGSFVLALQRPRWRRLVLIALIVEGAAAGIWFTSHRVHVGNALEAAVFSTTGVARAMCADVIARLD